VNEIGAKGHAVSDRVPRRDTAHHIVDAHIHVWSPDRKKYPLAPGFAPDDLWLPSFTPDDHFQYSRTVGKIRLNLVQMTWYGLDHSYILDLIASDPETYTGTGIVSAISDVSLPDPSKAMLALAKRGIRAFRVRGGKTGRPTAFGRLSRWLDYPGYESMFKTGAEHNLALSFLMGLEDLTDLYRMCRRFPETPIIIDHLCGVRICDGVWPEYEVRALCKMARYPQIMVKIGPFQALGNGQAPYLDLLSLIERVVDAFGPERVMWESDSGGPIAMKDPERDFAASIALIRDHADFLSDGDKEQILVKTAADFFFNR
jgi:predicted TIM-barrel fold metal-dependent hydrolase